MKISMEIDGYLAGIQYDRNIQVWRSEFLRREGGADFLAENWPKILSKLAEPILAIGNPLGNEFHPELR